MIISENRLSVIFDEDEKHLTNSNLQYSLTLIEATLDYIRLINAEVLTDKTSIIVKKIISVTHFDELQKILCSKEMLKELLKDHERIISQLRKCFEKYREKDEGRFIASVIEKHQSIAMKLRKSFSKYL